VPNISAELIRVEKSWPFKSPGFQVFSKNAISVLKLGAVPSVIGRFAKFRFREFYLAEGLNPVIGVPNHINVATFFRIRYMFWLKSDESRVLAKRSK
jgi:hypothetical protein